MEAIQAIALSPIRALAAGPEEFQELVGRTAIRERLVGAPPLATPGSVEPGGRVRRQRQPTVPQPGQGFTRQEQPTTGPNHHWAVEKVARNRQPLSPVDQYAGG